MKDYARFFQRIQAMGSPVAHLTTGYNLYPDMIRAACGLDIWRNQRSISSRVERSPLCKQCEAILNAALRAVKEIA